ncbi:unnamed protein product [Arctogadus glacialis]
MHMVLSPSRESEALIMCEPIVRIIFQRLALSILLSGDRPQRHGSLRAAILSQSQSPSGLQLQDWMSTLSRRSTHNNATPVQGTRRGAAEAPQKHSRTDMNPGHLEPGRLT